MENEKEQPATPLPEVRGSSASTSSREDAAVEVGADATPQTETTLETSPAYEKLKEEKEALYDRLLRKQAEFENFRRRAQREKEEFRQHANESLMRELLPVLDAFDRALRHRSLSVPETFYHGMELIHGQLLEALKRAGLAVIETEGQLFDPHYHQAVETVEDASRRDQEIVEELQRGYKLGNHLLRPAIVRVAVRPKSGASRSTEGTAKAN